MLSMHRQSPMLAAVARHVSAPRVLWRRAANRVWCPGRVTSTTRSTSSHAFKNKQPSSTEPSSDTDPLPSPSISERPGGQMGTVISETVAYDRYLTVFDRTVSFKGGTHGVPVSDTALTVKYDVVGHPRANFRFAVIFPFHPADEKTNKQAQVTVIREYCQASNEMGYSLPTGGFNPKKHKSLADSAIAELAEEAMLEGNVIDMLDAIDENHPGFVEGKWCSNRFRPYLATGLRSIKNPPARDAEEFSIEISRVTIPEFKKIMYSGQMMVPSMVTANMALERLRRDGYVLD